MSSTSDMSLKGEKGVPTCYGWVLAYIPAAGRLKIVYEDGGSEELYSSEVYPVLVSSEPRPSQTLERLSGCRDGRLRNDAALLMMDDGFSCMDDDGEHEDLGELQDLDLNEGVNLELHEGLCLNEGFLEECSGIRDIIDLNLDIGKRFVNVGDAEKGRVVFSMESREENHQGTVPPELIRKMQLHDSVVDYGDGVSGTARRGRRGRKRRELSDTVLRRPKVELPPSSGSLDLKGVSVFEFVFVYAFLRSFSALLFLSPFELDGSASASDCLRSLNWDFVDVITWPAFAVEYFLLHSPGYIPGFLSI
ncbi:hypothetical protein Salat_0477400 [Sesamum alatum]|uniref:Uncharacterized protein n=1 Tax=Sesamum alatum TaxID=300844 RepID=A0AAE2D0R0_9LAMI|nr:hypothetical protein Salat_0477400 [Sesamum alatum]